MELPEATTTLTRTPAVVTALLADLPPDWLHRNDGPGTWSAYDITGHLLHGDATNWVPRARTILTHGTEQAFEPFDREATSRRSPKSSPDATATTSARGAPTCPRWTAPQPPSNA